jgi:hypothetical protein
MWRLFLDESGDLGFDFVNKRPSKFFTICVLAISDEGAYHGLRKAVKKTLARKVNRGGRARQLQNELKATETNIGTKKHFYAQVASLKFGLYALTLNKRRVFEALTREKERIYNWIARQVMDQIPFEKASSNDTQRVQVVVDRCKGKWETREFNNYLIGQLKGRLDPGVALHVDHQTSEQEPALQAVDLFAWGVFRRYEKKDEEWLGIFRDKLIYDGIYLK